MNSVSLLVSLLLLLLWRYSVVYSSESGPEYDYYTAHFPSGWNYTYSTGKSSSRSHWNETRAAQEILHAHNEARRERNRVPMVSTCRGKACSFRFEFYRGGSYWYISVVSSMLALKGCQNNKLWMIIGGSKY